MRAVLSLLKSCSGFVSSDENVDGVEPTTRLPVFDNILLDISLSTYSSSSIANTFSLFSVARSLSRSSVMPATRSLRSSSSSASTPAPASPTASAPTTPQKLPRNLPSDIRDFLLGYPSLSSSSRSSSRSSSKNANLLFYKNKGPGRPSKKGVTGLQDELRGDYRELESVSEL